MTENSHDSEAMHRVVNRLKRADGQLHALIASIGPDANCRDVVIQLAAVSKAIDRAGFALVASALQDCVSADGDTKTHDGMDVAEIEKLFLSLA
ncbi:MAG: metal-sensitive transcriptional regulator [Pseudolysinimonas sp.]